MSELLLKHFDLLAQAPDGVARLRELILTLAVQGKLVPQDPTDEPASVLLQRIRAEKDLLIAEGKIKRDKPLPPITEEEKPFELPRGWEWSRLGDLTLQITDGTHHTPTYLPKGVAFISVKDIDGKTVNFDQCKYISPEEHLHINSRCDPERGDLLICRIGTLGRVTLVDTDRRFSLFVSVGLLKLPKECDTGRFMHLVMSSPPLEVQYQAIKAGGSHTNKLNLGDLPNLLIPVAPLANQARIVARVEELMRLCDALEAKQQLDTTQHAQLVQTLLGTLTDSTSPEELATAWQRVATHFDLLLDRPEAVDALEQTILQLAVRGLLVPQDPTDEPASVLLQRIRAEKDRLIAEGKIKRDKPLPPIADEEKPFELPQGWEWVRIDGVSEVQGGIQKTPLRRPVKNHHPYLRVANVQRDAFKLNDIERYELTDEELARWCLRPNDLLIVEGNGSEDEIGRCAVWSGQISDCVFQNHLIRVRCFDPACVQFLKLFLNSPSGTDEMKRLAITTSGLYNLSVGKIRNFAFPLPPRDEQTRIVALVAELRHLCAGLRQRLNASRSTQGHVAEYLVENLAA